MNIHFWIHKEIFLVTLIIQLASEEFLKLGFPDAEISIMRARTHTHTQHCT